ncbi:hypothetical protein ABIE67_010216 [Streptomyces sp. V4I8]|uniref:hypothetical protein n=1 Tax=Streptomyces sp. V4I8 TaxID=3156469 RepID=UPI00351262F1
MISRTAAPRVAMTVNTAQGIRPHRVLGTVNGGCMVNETNDIEYAIGDRVLDRCTSKVGTIQELPDRNGLYTITGAYTAWTRRAKAAHLVRMPSMTDGLVVPPQGSKAIPSRTLFDRQSALPDTLGAC